LCFFFQAEDGIRDDLVTGVQTCALPIWLWALTCFLGARERLRAAALVVFIQVLVGIPFLILVFQNMTRYKTAFAQEIHTPFLQWPHILATVLAVALVFLTKESSVVKFWLTAVGVAPVIAMNQQVLTGLSVEPW